MRIAGVTTMTVTTIVVAMASLAIESRPVDAGEQAAATKVGWWIRIATDRTKATSINFEIGRRERDHEPWRTWRAGDPVEFDVPEGFLQSPRLYVRAGAMPSGSIAWLCLMYKDHGVKHFDFDSSEAQMKEQTDTDDECK